MLLVCPGPIERKDARLYPLAGLEDVPESARAPGRGCKCGRFRPQRLAARDFAGVPAPPTGTGHPRQGPAAVRVGSAMAQSGRLDRAAEEWLIAGYSDRIFRHEKGAKFPCFAPGHFFGSGGPPCQPRGVLAR